MSSDIAIKTENLSKCYHIYDKPRDRLKQMLSFGKRQFYKEFWPLNNISFEIMKGETIGIIGKNGSGKSTVLQLICGIVNPTSGEIITNGRISALLELGAGFNPEFTGRENVYMNASLYGLTRKEIDNKIDRILEFADIGEFVDQPVKTYSSGMYVRLAFSIQANMEPDIFIIDEALAVGDAQFVHRCMLRLNELQKIGTTILFVSHDVTSVKNLCSRAIWLVDGSIKKIGNSSEVVDAYLYYIFQMQDVATMSDYLVKTGEEYKENDQKLKIETAIPNIDRRFGDRRCEIIGVALYDESMNKISSTYNEEVVVLRLTAKNHALQSETKLSAGYIFRNSKGLEIASSNSLVEGRSITLKRQGDLITILIKVTLPRLYPGSYTFSLSVSYVEPSGKVVLLDRIENAIILEILSRKKVHVMMSFPTIFEVEY